jgi:regulator of sigma E protease
VTQLLELGRTGLAFVFALGVIIFVHEAGHFVAARAFGMRVLAFSLGFGRKLVGFRRGETDYKIGWIPLGGYVKLSGEDPEDQATDDPRDFLNRPRLQRIVVYLAGPCANALLSILLIAGLFVVGVDIPTLQAIPTVVGTVEAGGAGAAAGIRPGDEIVAVAGQPVERWQQVAFTVMTSIGKPLAFELEREGKRVTTTVTPVKPADFEFGDAGIYPKILPRIGSVLPGSPAQAAGLAIGDELYAVDGRPLASPGEFVDYVEARIGQPIRVELMRQGARRELTVTPADQDGKGRIGVGLTLMQKYPPGRALVESVRFNFEIARQSLAVIGKIFKREVAAKSALAGPIEIAAQSGQAARTGWKSLLYLMGVISISIGLLNLFPIPILDGGQIAILLVESVIRRDLSLAIKERIAQVGFALIVLLMVTVLWFDVSKRLFGS